MVPPYFSVIIPTFNRGSFLSRTVESVLSQSYNDFELIIVDDGSTDNTEDVVMNFKDRRIRYFMKENGERGAARNVGIKEAKGEYVTFLDSDDRFFPNNLAFTKSFIDENKNSPFVHIAYRVVDENGKEITKIKHPKSNPEYNLLKGNDLSCLGVFVRCDVIKNHLFEEDRDLSGSEDWVLWMRLASRYPLLVSNEITSELVQHDERSVLQTDPERLINRIRKAGYLVTQDPAFKKKFSGNDSLVWAHLNLYSSLHLVLAKHKSQSLSYLLKAFKVPSIWLSQKPYAILNQLILR